MTRIQQSLSCVKNFIKMFSSVFTYLTILLTNLSINATSGSVLVNLLESVGRVAIGFFVQIVERGQFVCFHQVHRARLLARRQVYQE